jgi:hypothetical protein
MNPVAITQVVTFGDIGYRSSSLASCGCIASLPNRSGVTIEIPITLLVLMGWIRGRVSCLDGCCDDEVHVEPEAKKLESGCDLKKVSALVRECQTRLRRSTFMVRPRKRKDEVSSNGMCFLSRAGIGTMLDLPKTQNGKIRTDGREDADYIDISLNITKLSQIPLRRSITVLYRHQTSNCYHIPAVVVPCITNRRVGHTGLPLRGQLCIGRAQPPARFEAIPGPTAHSQAG